MKTVVTKEQTQRLIYLGVPEEKATEFYFDREEFVYSVFSLEDFLNGEMLPKEILIPNTKAYALEIRWIIGLKSWLVIYQEIESNVVIADFYAPELIDAIYELTCWYYGVYLKSEKK